MIWKTGLLSSAFVWLTSLMAWASASTLIISPPTRANIKLQNKLWRTHSTSGSLLRFFSVYLPLKLSNGVSTMPLLQLLIWRLAPTTFNISPWIMWSSVDFYSFSYCLTRTQLCRPALAPPNSIIFGWSLVSSLKQVFRNWCRFLCQFAWVRTWRNALIHTLPLLDLNNFECYSFLVRSGYNFIHSMRNISQE